MPYTCMFVTNMLSEATILVVILSFKKFTTYTGSNYNKCVFTTIFMSRNDWINDPQILISLSCLYIKCCTILGVFWLQVHQQWHIALCGCDGKVCLHVQLAVGVLRSDHDDAHKYILCYSTVHNGDFKVIFSFHIIMVTLSRLV